jgi:ABC-2 type transport system ATP-binding protein
MSHEVIIETRNLTKVYRDFWGRPKVQALKALDLKVFRGEIFGLLGPNGSGKTTTIKLLLGLLFPTEGEALIFNEPTTNVAKNERIGYLPEESYLYKFLNAEETLQFYGRLFKIPAGERNKRVGQLIDMVGLTAAKHRQLREYSKGMQRRIGLAQALINDPDLVILDEPTSGLDPIGCREVKDLIVALARRGKTVILSSHLLADVEDVCDRVVIYYGGKIQAAGTLKELLAEPDTLRITTPVLPRETLERVLEVIRHDVATDKVRVDNPTQNLESYFLDVVQKARAAAAQTSGAQSGARVAAYLRAGAEEPAAAEKILEKLSLPQPAAQPVATPRPAAPAAVPKVDEKKLEAMARVSAPSPSPAKPAPSPEAKPADLSKADEKLSSLLGKPK